MYLGNVAKPLRIECKDSPIHGQGIFTTEDIAAHDIILGETLVDALITTDGAVETPTDSAFEFLSDEERAAFYSLHYDPMGSEVNLSKAIFLEHALDILDYTKGGTFKGICLAISKLNHSPYANASLSWNHEKRQIVVKAMRRLEKGEEITIAYCCRRRQFNNSDYPSLSFECYCEICSLVLLPATACLCPVCKADLIWNPESETETKAELENKPHTQKSDSSPRILTEQMMKMNIETSLKEEKEAILRNSKSSEQKSPESKKAVGMDEDDFSDGFYAEEDCLESDEEDNIGDLENFDVRPGLHSWLE